MTDLMDILYGCARDAFVEDILQEDGEYSSRMRYFESEQKQLTDILDKDLVLKVNDLLDEKAAIAELRECAWFRAGFQIALELTR